MGRRVVRTPEGDVTISADSEMLLDLVEQTIVASRLVMAEPAHTIGRLSRVTRLDDTEQTDTDRKGPLFGPPVDPWEG